MNAKRTPTDVGSQADVDGSKSPLRLALSANLLAARDQANISQRELAEKAGVNQRMIWEIERKARNVTLETVSALARAIGKSEWDLLARRFLAPRKDR